jgi:hypothetical protein
MRPLRVFALALALVAVGAGDARATNPVFPPAPSSVSRYLTIAERYFGRAPACPALFVYVTPVFGTGGDGDYPGGSAEQPGCRMWIRRDTFHLSRDPWYRQDDVSHLCLIIVHEYGHLLGLGHSSWPGDVMFAGGLPPLRAVPGCYRAVHHRWPR